MKNPIFDIENWREIGATLSRNKTRTFLTAFGIFWGTAMLAMLWGGAHGLESLMKRQFNGLATNFSALFPNQTSISYKGFNKGFYWQLTQTDIDAIRKISPYMEYSTTCCQAFGPVAYGTKTKQSTVMGFEPDFSKINEAKVYTGRVLNEADEREARKVALLGKDLAAYLFADEDPIGKMASINGIYYKVIGVIGQKSEATFGGRYDDSAIIPAHTFRNIYNWGDEVSYFLYSALPGHKPKDMQPAIRRVLLANHPISPDDESAIHFFDISEMFEMVDNLFLGLSLLALFVGAGALMAGIIGIGNIMWIIVKERTQEIGIRRAIGAKPRDIIAQILSESVLMTSVAGLIGVCFATLVLVAVENSTYDPARGEAHFLLSFSQSVGIVITFLVLGTLAGTLPAIKAMRIKPIEAMRDK